MTAGTRTVLTLAAVAMAILLTTAHQVSAAELTHDATVQVSDNESVFNVSVSPGKAGYDNGTVSGIFGGGTVLDYRFFTADSDTLWSWSDGGAGIVAPIPSPPPGNIAGPVNQSQNWPDVWITSDPDTDPADFTTNTQAGAQNITGTIDVSGLGSGTLYFIHGTYYDSFALSLTMSGSGQPDIQAEYADDPPNTVNMGWVTSFTFSTGGVYDTVTYSYTNTDADGSRARFMGAIVAGAIVKAYGATPRDGAMVEANWVNMSWQPGQLAVSHDVYLSDSFDDVNNGTTDAFQGNQGATMLIAGFVGFALPDGLVPGTTYYWRVDEINEADPNSPWKGDVWSFWIPPKIAWEPAPGDGDNYVAADVELSWTPGFGAQLHTVYLGENIDDVSNATGGTTQTETTFTPSSLEMDKTYYWRVDEFEAPVTHKGDVWSFTTRPVVPLHSDPDLVAWWTFDEGQGTTAIDWSGHGNHAALSGSEWTAAALGDTGLHIGSHGAIQNLNYAATDLTEVSVAAWVRTDSSGDQYIVSFDRNEYYRLEINGSGGGPGQVGWDVMTSSGQVDYGSIKRVNDGLWHHVTGVYDNGTLTIYIDGVPEPSASGGPTFGTGTTRFGFIGANSEASSFDGNRGGGSPIAGEVDDIRIYHRALTQEEIAAVMRGDPKLANSPAPARNAIVDIRDISSLSWSKGDTAASHDVYFGADRDAMEFKGNQAATSLSLADLVEFGGGDYYWRIDEVEAGGTVVAGTIWKFTVPDYLIVDDFESYNDIEEGQEGSNRIYLTWIDGYGTTNNGSQAGNLDVPLMSQGHNSAQAMPLLYDNAGKTSEATMTLVSKKDWTEHGVTKLVVWFRGDPANAAERMYVALGNAIVYHPDDAAAQISTWTEWVIDLADFAGQGANLSNVPSITIGFGTRGAPAATGGTGTVEFDDIGLIP
jgi:hypothetical protein